MTALAIFEGEFYTHVIGQLLALSTAKPKIIGISNQLTVSMLLIVLFYKIFLCVFCLIIYLFLLWSSFKRCIFKNNFVDSIQDAHYRYDIKLNLKI